MHCTEKICDYKELQTYWTLGFGAELVEAVERVAQLSKGDKTRLVLLAKERLADTASAEDLETAIQVVLCREQLRKTGLPWAEKGLFVEKQLQQASNRLLTEFHASRFARCSTVADMCCGLGFDSAALAEKVEVVWCVEADPLIAAFAAHNLAVQNCVNCTVRCMTAEDFCASPEFLSCDGLWVDPDRRSGGGQRVHAGSEYSPSLQYLLELPFRGPIGIKVAPVFDTGSLTAEIAVEIVGCERETKEQILWRNAGQPSLQISIVDLDFVWQLPDSPAEEATAREIQPGEYILEPHNAIRQAQRLGQFFASFGAAALAGAPLGVGAEPASSSAVSSFKVLSTCTFRPKEVSRMLKQLGWGSASVIKKCGVPESAEKIRSMLRFEKDGLADPAQVLFVIGLGQKKIAVCCSRVL